MAGPYQQYPPEAPAGARELPKGLSTTAMVLGIVGLVLSALGCTWFLGLPCDILAIIFGAVAISKARHQEQGGEGMAKAGLICGIIGFFVVVVWFVIIFIWGAYLAQYAPYYYYRY